MLAKASSLNLNRDLAEDPRVVSIARFRGPGSEGSDSGIRMDSVSSMRLVSDADTSAFRASRASQSMPSFAGIPREIELRKSKAVRSFGFSWEYVRLGRGSSVGCWKRMGSSVDAVLAVCDLCGPEELELVGAPNI